MTKITKRTIVFWMFWKISTLLVADTAIENADAKLQRWQQALALNPNDANLLNETGLALFNADKYGEAERLLLQSLAIWKQSGKEPLNVAASLHNLALVYSAQTKYSKAESYFLESLKIRERTLGRQNPIIIKDLNDLVEIYYVQSKYGDAESSLIRAKVIGEKTSSKNHSDVSIRLDFATTLHYLGVLYIAQGKYDNAEPLLQDSLNIRETTLGKQNFYVAESLDNLAALYYRQGKYKKAIPLGQRSLDIHKEALNKGEESSYRVAEAFNSLGEIYRATGIYKGAEIAFLRSLAASLDKDLPIIAGKLEYLAEISWIQLLAQTLFKRYSPDPVISLDILASLYTQDLATYSSETYVCLNNLALLYDKWGKHQQSESFLKLSLSILEKKLGKNHPDATTLSNLAKVYNGQNKYGQAEPLLQKSLRKTNQSLERWLWVASEKTRQSYLQQEEFDRNYYLSFYSFRNTPEEAFYFSLSRKSLLLKIASEIGIVTKYSPELKSLRTQIANLSYSTVPDKNAKIKALEEESNTLELQLLQNNSSLKRSKTEITPEQIVAQLTNKQVLIDFLVYDQVDLKTRKYKTQQLIALVHHTED
jgi:tetratricopeptide (TPR) repeat protein